MLEKKQENRPEAIEITKHLWFSQVETEPVKSPTLTEVSLHHTVHRIRRNNFKNKEKRSRRKLKDLMNAHRLSDTRLEFLVHSSTEESESQMSVSMM